MGNKSTKSSLKNAIVMLSISADSIQADDDKFWEQIWNEDPTRAADIIKSIRTQEIRMLRDGSPKNFAILTYKMIERLSVATGSLCNTTSQQTAVINASRILIRILPCMFEDKTWNNFLIENQIEPSTETNAITGPKISFPTKSDRERDYTSYLPNKVDHKASTDSHNRIYHHTKLDKGEESPNNREQSNEGDMVGSDCLLKSLVLSICDLLFCPEFTVPSHSHGYLSNSIDGPPEDLKSLATCDYVWEPGVGFDSSVNSTTYYDKNRSVLLKLLLTSLGTTLYETSSSCVYYKNHCIGVLVSKENRHALPLFTSLLNITFRYNPTRTMPFNHIFFEDVRENLVELALQILISTLDYSIDMILNEGNDKNDGCENLFIEYTSRIHRSEDFAFIVTGMTRLLNSRLEQSYLLGSSKLINFEHELLILNWKLCNLNKKYISYLLKTKDVIDIVIPILQHLNENFQDSTKTALIHIGVFNLLILSGERNFGVRLNKPYVTNTLIGLPSFSGSHADLMIIVFHKLILYGYDLNQLFDFLLTIIVNISPYLKSLTLIASNCLIQLFEIFSSSSVVLTEPSYHQLVLFLLEIFNNIIQYQFDGNANLIYSIINRKEVFLNLANMPTSQTSIQKVIKKLLKIKHEHLAKFGVAPNEHRGDGSSSSGSTRNMTAAAYVTADNMSGISLLATPDITDVTHPTNPNMDLPFKKEGLRQEDATTARHQLSLDDILNQSASGTVNLSEDSPMISLDGIDFLSKDTNDCSTPLIDPKRDDSSEESTANIGQTAIPSGSEIDVESNGSDRTSNDLNNNKERTPVWRPTSGWLKEWKQSLPLQTILRMIEVLVPQVDNWMKENSSTSNKLEIIRFLQNGTLVGLLPVPHPILIRKYHTNEETRLWFRVCTWSVIYHRNPIWSDTGVKLIKLV